VTRNEELIILQNSATRKNHYVVIFEVTQLIDNKERAREVYQTTITFINKVSARKSTTSQYAFNNEISKINNIKKKNYKLKKKNLIEKIKKKNFKKELEKKSRRIIEQKTKFSAKSKKKIIKQKNKTKSNTKSDKIKRKIDFTLKSNIKLFTNEKNSARLLSSTILDVDYIITIFLQVFVNIKKDYLRLFSLAKTIITSNLVKTNKKEVVKILNIIKKLTNNIII